MLEPTVETRWVFACLAPVKLLYQ